jgi:hypothetical protein
LLCDRRGTRGVISGSHRTFPISLGRAKALLRGRVFRQRPKLLKDHRLSGRVYCTPRALWKLNWLLRDFGYDTELLSRGEVNDRALVRLQGVVKVSYAIVKGMFYLNFDAFAPAEKWKELSPFAADEHPRSEVA